MNDNRKPIVIGNWKMNGNKASVATLLDDLVAGEASVEYAELVVCPPYVYLQETQQRLMDSTIELGAQNMSQVGEGAYTGEISIEMLQDFTCRYVIVGHSERRQMFHESDMLVAQKFLMALDNDLIPILCVGETLEEREAGNTLKIIKKQLAAALILSDNHARLNEAIVAYEPIWAIGTGKVATPAEAQTVHAAIRAQLREQDESLADTMRVIYGGSVKANNACELFNMADIDGALVGGASLKAEDFLKIGQACNRL